MSEVEKMYKNCNIKPKQKGYCDWDSNCPYPHHKCNDECPYWKYEDEAKYPPFTAEKQIEIVKAITTNHIGDDYEHKYLGIDRDEIDREFYLNLCINGSRYHAHDKDFAIALAKLVNLIWQDLTEEERKQIKEILE